MNTEVIQNNKVKSILQFSIPSIIAMVLTSLITVADGFFIGNFVGEEGLAAVNLGLPIVYLFLAVGLMVSVGGVAIAGMALGGGDTQRSNNVFRQTMLTSVFATVMLSIIISFCLKPILYFLNTEGLAAQYFIDYYGIMLLELPVMVIIASFGMFIRAEGKPQFFMQVNILNVLLNILLNYLCVRWLGWGVKGVAFASLFSALISLCFVLRFFLKRSDIFKLGRFTFSGQVLKNTLLNGSSEFIGEMSLCISMFAYNFVILKNIGIDGITAFAIAGYIAYIFSMIVIGFGQGASPLISFSFGAGEKILARSLRKITNFFVLGAGTIFFLFVLLASGWYSEIFVNNESINQMIQSGMPLFALSFLFAGVNVITSFYFTSIGKAKESAAISSARGFVILLICIFTLPPILGMTGVWLTAPITELATILLSFIFIAKDMSGMKRQ
ncbi:MAG: MATE family efflux transporter [Treponema sp.]|jgi:putative MATE family efflux protein|nr:MATE family efflux transporter [Treponema sp.]